MTTDSVLAYWRYYCSLERQLSDIEQYVEFDLHRNGKTYSLELLKLFMACCSELDVLCKRIVEEINPGLNRDCFRDRVETILKKYPRMSGYSIKIRDNPVNPWKSIDWWSDYNKVKHHRNENDMRIIISLICCMVVMK